jgi:activator of HSP90 ATPase
LVNTSFLIALNIISNAFYKRVNKDCLPWAKIYLQDQLSGLSAEKNGVKVQINSLDECTGDVDLNQRKGRILAIYDVALQLSWQAQDASGTKVFGKISIPEVAYDTELDDYVVNGLQS